MSLGSELGEFVGGLFERAAALPEAQRKAEEERIRGELRAALERLDGIEPNAPRIHELGEKRRAELGAERPLGIGCRCGGTIVTAAGSTTATHSTPACEAFQNLAPGDFARWLAEEARTERGDEPTVETVLPGSRR